MIYLLTTTICSGKQGSVYNIRWPVKIMFCSGHGSRNHQKMYVERNQIEMSFSSCQLKNVDVLKTHPRRVARKGVSMGGMVRPTSSVVHSDFNSFTNPQMHERRPNPQRFHRQMKFSQAAYHRNSFACYWLSKTDRRSRVVTRHLLFNLKKSASFKSSA